MYYINMQNDVIGLVLREICKSNKRPALLDDRADLTTQYISLFLKLRLPVPIV